MKKGCDNIKDINIGKKVYVNGEKLDGRNEEDYGRTFWA